MKYLKEGVLQEDFILDNIPRLMGLMRDANVTLRWTMLHCASLQSGQFDDCFNAGVNFVTRAASFACKPGSKQVSKVS